jgi:hypothetical protein
MFIVGMVILAVTLAVASVFILLLTRKKIAQNKARSGAGTDIAREEMPRSEEEGTQRDVELGEAGGKS